jgi:hypothetical protein
VVAGELQHRPGRLHPLGDLRRTGSRGVQGQAAAEVLAEGAVAGLRRTAGGDQITHARQPGERVLVGAERRAEPGDLGQAPGDQQRLGVVAEPHADRDADGDRDHVLDRARQLTADHVRVGVRAEIGGVARLL